MDADTLKKLATNPAAYREVVRIDTDDGPVAFGGILDDWQMADFAALDGGWARAIGRPSEGEVYRRAYLERARGHSKTNDLALMATWALAFSTRSVSGVAAAGDLDQAKLLRNAPHG